MGYGGKGGGTRLGGTTIERLLLARKLSSWNVGGGA